MKKYLVVFTLLIFAVTLSGQKTVEFPELANPGQILVDPENKNLYISDGTTIYIYSLTDYHLKKKFGKSGEGPKEFKRYANMTLTPDHLFVNSVSRVTFFTKEGIYLKEMNSKSANLGPFLPIGKNYVNTGMDRSEKALKYSLNLYDSKLNKIKTIGFLSRNEQRGKKRINALDWGFPKFRVFDNKIFCEELDNELLVFDSKGKKLFQWDVHSLIPGYKKVQVTDEYKNRFFEILKLRARQEFERVKKQLDFPKYFTIIRDYIIRDSNIYIFTFVKKGNKSEIHQFDLDGKHIKTFFQENIEQNAFQFYPFDIKNGKLYQLYDEDDTWTLLITDLR
ncbi:MAG: hypothetical protein KAQ98_14760 [Bacteriovoracaceae bacterium]|nr:hypothetical protein [Bacteriovoracaceae bacterium]